MARDVMTYLFAPDRAMATLLANEKNWGGTIAERMAANEQAWKEKHQPAAPPPVADDGTPDGPD
jgi:penicillin-binding protein 2